MSSTPLFDAIAQRPAPTFPAVERLDSTRVASAMPTIDEASRPAATASAHQIGVEQFLLVNAVADAIMRAVTDAVTAEVARICHDGAIRA